MFQMKGRIVIYSTVGCPHCLKAKSTLQDQGLDYTDVSVNSHPSVRQWVQARTGKTSVPQIFFNSTYIGGNDDLQKLISEKDEWEKALEELNETPPDDALPVPDPDISPEGDGVSCEEDEDYGLFTNFVQSGIPESLRVSFFKVSENSFKGSQLVDWLKENHKYDEESASKVGEALFLKSYIKVIKGEGGHFCQDTIYQLICQFPSDALNAEISHCKPLPASEIGEQIRVAILKLFSEFISKDGMTVDYEGMKASKAFEDYETLTKQLQRVDLTILSEEEKVSFFINIYNALAIHGFVRMGYPTSTLGRWKYFNRTSYIIGGNKLSLQEIENGVLRGNKKGMGMLFQPFSSSDPRVKLIVKSLDPRIHFALNCGGRSCPPIKTYSAQNVEEELQLATQSFLESPDALEINLDKKEINLSSLFKWYNDDFGTSTEEILKWIAERTTGQNKKHLQEMIDSQEYRVKYLKYDWSSNSA